jgi:hypothetical protein
MCVFIRLPIPNFWLHFLSRKNTVTFNISMFAQFCVKCLEFVQITYHAQRVHARAMHLDSSKDFDMIYHFVYYSAHHFPSSFTRLYTCIFVLTSRDNTCYARTSFPRSNGVFDYFYSKSVRKFLIYIARTALLYTVRNITQYDNFTRVCLC